VIAMSKRRPYEIASPTSPAGQKILARHGVTLDDLQKAIAIYSRQVCPIGTQIGVSNDGFIGSERPGWRAHPVGPLIAIPWVHVLELLGRVPPGTTSDFLNSGGQRH
jgi:hypothetical protein